MPDPNGPDQNSKINRVEELTAEARDLLDQIQCESTEYFLHQINAKNGLMKDKTEDASPASIAAVGLGITSLIVAIERDLIDRQEALNLILAALLFFNESEQGLDPTASGYKGFYYHYLDMETGKRAWQSELSTIDTAILFGGILSAAAYFQGDELGEHEVRTFAQSLYERVDWKWACNEKNSLTHGWTPESGFLNSRWDQGYSEAILLYVLALGSPTHPIDPSAYTDWTKTFEWINSFGIEWIYAGPLFIHQMSHVWIDFRNIRDEANQRFGIDYFENSRRATHVQQQYSIANPLKFEKYGEHTWGFTASDGPGPKKKEIDGREIEFYNYTARGAPFGPDDGTFSPWVVVASLPFAAEIVVPTVTFASEKMKLMNAKQYGFESSVNLTVQKEIFDDHIWRSPVRFGINQGPIIIMIENHRNEMIWKLMKKCEVLNRGLEKAGFKKVSGT